MKAISTRSATCRNCASDFEYQSGGGVARPLCPECEQRLKWCPSCGYALIHEAFGPDPRVRGGLEGCCKQCKTRQFRARRARGYRWDPRKARISKLTQLYGVTQADWDRMLIQQSGRCAICQVASASLAVDHCHETGVVRGLLCPPCNMGLGHLGDDVDRMLSAIAYLLTSREG